MPHTLLRQQRFFALHGLIRAHTVETLLPASRLQNLLQVRFDERQQAGPADSAEDCSPCDVGDDGANSILGRAKQAQSKRVSCATRYALLSESAHVGGCRGGQPVSKGCIIIAVSSPQH